MSKTKRVSKKTMRKHRKKTMKKNMKRSIRKNGKKSTRKNMKKTMRKHGKKSVRKTKKYSKSKKGGRTSDDYWAGIFGSKRQTTTPEPPKKVNVLTFRESIERRKNPPKSLSTKLREAQEKRAENITNAMSVSEWNEKMLKDKGMTKEQAQQNFNDYVAQKKLKEQQAQQQSTQQSQNTLTQQPTSNTNFFTADVELQPQEQTIDVSLEHLLEQPKLTQTASLNTSFSQPTLNQPQNTLNQPQNTLNQPQNTLNQPTLNQPTLNQPQNTLNQPQPQPQQPQPQQPQQPQPQPQQPKTEPK